MARKQDKYFGAPVQLSDPANEAVPIVPADTSFEPARGLYVGTGGDISMKGVDDTDWVLWKTVPAGWLPFRVKAVRATGTTASNMLALY